MNESSEPTTREVIRDLGVLVAVPVVLVAVRFLVPSAVGDTLALDHADPAPHALFTAAFVHNSVSHLQNNVVGYVLAAIYTFALALFVGRLGWFRRVFAVNVLLLPVVINVADLLTWGVVQPAVQPVSRGFSGVAAAFVGSLLVAVYVFLAERHGPDVGQAVGVATFMLSMLLIGLRYAGPDPVLLGLVAVGVTLSVGPTVYRQSRDGGLSVGRDAVWSGAATVLVGVVLGYMIVALFPPAAAIVEDGTAVNLYAHLIGFLLGIVSGILGEKC